MRPSLARAALALLGLLAGCADWPRYGHLPSPDPTVHPGSTDPSTLFQVSWKAGDEAEDNATPAAAQSGEIALDEGIVVTGALDTIGWDDEAEPKPISDDACGSTGFRTAYAPGDYVGDVDFYRITVDEAGQLCARADVDSDQYGWDLLVFPIDGCGVPGTAIPGKDGEALGLGFGGATGGWGVPVEPGDYAILFAGYYPNDADVSLGYHLGASLVHADADGSVGACPDLPEGS